MVKIMRSTVTALIASLVLAACGGGDAPSTDDALRTMPQTVESQSVETGSAQASSAFSASIVLGKVSEKRISRTQFDYEFTATLTNGPVAAASVVATVASNAPATIVVQGVASFGSLAAGAAGVSSQKIVLRHDRSVPFDPAALVWQFEATGTGPRPPDAIPLPTDFAPPDLVASAAGMFRVVLPPGLHSSIDGLLSVADSLLPNGWVSRSSGSFTLFFNTANMQTAILLYDGNLNLPFRSSLKMDGTQLARPIVVLSNVGGSIETEKLPGKLQQVIADYYYNQQSFDIKRGLTQFGAARVGGELGNVLNKLVGAPRNPNNQVELALRWGYGPLDDGQEPPEPSDLQSIAQADRADAMRAWLAWYKGELEERQAQEDADAGKPVPTKELQLQFWMPPAVRWNGPLGMAAVVQLSDADITWSSTGSLKFIGNLYVNDKRLLAHYSGPYSIIQKLAALQKLDDAVELADVVFLASTPPSYTLKDHADLMRRLLVPLPLVPVPSAVWSAASELATPLALFGVTNPLPQPVYSTGSDIPPVEAFNLQFVGPLGEYDERKGPIVGLSGSATVLGQPFGNLKVALDTSGLFATAMGSLNLNVGAGQGVGRLGSATASVAFSQSRKELSISGNFILAALTGVPAPGSATLKMDLNPNQVNARLEASCFPVTLNAGVGYSSFTNLSSLLSTLSPGFSTNNAEICAREIVAKVCSASGAVPGLQSACNATGNTLVAGAFVVGSNFVAASNFVAGYILDGVNALTGAFDSSGKSLWDQAQEATGDGFVQIQARHSGLCLDIVDRNKDNNAAVIQYTCEFRPNKFFIFDHLSDGWGKLRINHSNKCLDVRGASQGDGAEVNQFNCTNANNQQFKYVNGEWRIRHSNKCLDIQGASAALGARLIQQSCNGGLNQKFVQSLRADWMEQALDADYYLATYPDLARAFGTGTDAARAAARNHWHNFGIREGRKSRADFDVSYYRSRNSDVRQPISYSYMATPNDYAVWHWIRFGKDSGRASSPQQGPARVAHSNKCLTIENNAGNNGAHLIQYQCNLGSNQGFFFAHRGGGWGNLMARSSSKCLDVNAGSMARGVIIQQWDCNSGDNQLWRYEKTASDRGFYRNKNSNLCMGVSASSTANGAKVVQWDCSKIADQTFINPPRPN